MLRMALGLSAASRRPFRSRAGARASAGQRKTAPLLSETDIEAARALAAGLAGRLTHHADGSVLFELLADEDRPPARVTLPGAVPLVPFLLATVSVLATRHQEQEIIFEGSTHAPDGASFEVARSCFVPLLERMGVGARLVLDGAGFAPKGGGLIKATVLGSPKPLAALSLATKGPLRSISIFSGAPAAIPVHVQQRQAARARSGVAVAGVETNVQLIKLESGKAGSVVAITGLFDDLPITVSAVSRRGSSVESVGVEAASEFRRAVATASVVPPVLVEPLVLALAFAPGPSKLTTWRLPLDAEPLIALVGAFADREMRVEGKAGGAGTIEIEVADPPGGTSY